jgi:hypothetical protein
MTSNPLRRLAAVALLAVLAAGCGGTPTSKPEPAGQNAPPAAAPKTPPPGAKKME